MVLVTGWDVGGAHLKAALMEDGVVKDVLQLPSLIWTDLADLRRALNEALTRFGGSDVHAVTMTGELAEYFGSRAEGVRQISGLMQEALAGKDLRIYAGRAGFVPSGTALEHILDIASANWYASAEVVAQRFDQAILIDMGSSTTDIIPVFNGKICARGYSDAERLESGELIYTGVVRTPVFAVTETVPFEGEWQRLMNERFAVMADVYRILDRLPANVDLFDAVDGGKKDLPGSVVRLARMLGREANDHELWQWRVLANFLAQKQLGPICESVCACLSRFDFDERLRVIVAGAGSFVVQELAARFKLNAADFHSLFDVADGVGREKLAISAPAVAVGKIVQ